MESLTMKYRREKTVLLLGKKFSWETLYKPPFVHLSRWFKNEVTIQVKGPETMLTPSFRCPQKGPILADPDTQTEDCLPR